MRGQSKPVSLCSWTAQLCGFRGALSGSVSVSPRLWGCVSAPTRQDVQDAPAPPSRQAGPPDGVLGNCFEPFPPLDGTSPAQALVPDSWACPSRLKPCSWLLSPHGVCSPVCGHQTSRNASSAASGFLPLYIFSSKNLSFNSQTQQLGQHLF